MLDWIAALPPATVLRASGTAYLAVSAAHILGIALLVGSILPLDLRLAGGFGRVPLAVIAPFLRGVAMAGAVVAVVTGAALFSVNPAEYVTNPAFRIKLALLALAMANAALAGHPVLWARAMAAGQAPPTLRALALLSAVLWLSVLLAGRWIGFL